MAVFVRLNFYNSVQTRLVEFAISFRIFWRRDSILRELHGCCNPLLKFVSKQIDSFTFLKQYQTVTFPSVRV